ncbi:Phosphopentomutase [Candidatus Hartigia pinicola]|nr:Phosphopentomutase [Candidatus Hartigia pinicola]
MKRIFIIVLDSLGIGGASDAYKFDDEGSNTLGHIAEVCGRSEANKGRKGPLKLPNLMNLGLGKAAEESCGKCLVNFDYKTKIIGAYAYASELSSGKDTLSGHWEMVGVPVLFNWDYFINDTNSFPKDLLDIILKRAKLPGYLGNCHSSGVVILDQLGEEHIKTGKPILYTSADSVFQIACHEEKYGLDKLYAVCKITREELSKSNYNIARVIARPFIGDQVGRFKRTGNRHDFSVKPTEITILQKLVEEKQGEVVSIGKITDIYADVGITKKIKATGINALCDASAKEMKIAGDKTIVFTNFVDFDSVYGHSRDVSGYAAALELFDRRFPELLSLVKENDLLIITADHGCDPTWKGTDHTREHIPILLYGSKVKPGSLGHRETFSDIGQTIAKYFDLSPMKYGKSMI